MKVIIPGYCKTYMWSSRKSAFPNNDSADTELRHMRFNYQVP
jgi:hypothetical protein